MAQHSDAEIVAAARRYDIEDKIFNGSASREEMKDWYFSLDPLREDYTARLGSAEDLDAAEHTIAYSLSQAGLMGTVGQKLIAPHLPDPTQLPAMGTNDFYLPAVERANMVDSEILNDMIIAQDCFFRAGNYFADALRVSVLVNASSTEFSGSMAEISESYHSSSTTVHQTLAGLSLARLWVMGNGHASAEELGLTDQIFETSIYSSKQFDSNIFYQSQIHSGDTIKDLHYRQSHLENGFKNLVESIEDYIVNPALAEGQKVISDSTLKGHLHELLWLLDMNFTLLNDGRIADSFAVAAPLGYDNPRRIGKPKAERAYDIIIVTPQGNIPTQLKAGNYSASRHTYDERILVAIEQNFQDVNLKRLTSRLKDYREWIASGLSDGQIAEKIRKRALKTVQDATDKIANDTHEPQAPKNPDTVTYIGARSIDFLSATHPIVDVWEHRR